MKKRFLTRLAALAAALTILAPWAAPARAAHATTAGPSGFAVSLPAKLELTLGTPGNLEASILPEPEGSALDGISFDWDWICRTPDVLELQSSGNKSTLTPKTARSAEVTVTVTATINGTEIRKEASCQVTVQYTAADGITLSATTLELDQKGTQSLTASVSPSTADATNVNWKSDNPSVARLSADTGQSVTITGERAGTATITASSCDNVSATCAVTVRGLALSQNSLTLSAGGSKTLGATPYGGIGTHVEWTSGNDSVAFVSANGTVTGQSVGKTVITAAVGGYTESCEVEVVENTANTITRSAEAGQPFSFSEIRSDLNSRCNSVLGTALSYVTNLSAPTSQGILYYNYVSGDDTGSGVGGTERYYYSDSVPGARSLSQVCFVPNPDFNGMAVINYSGYNSGNQFFTGSIRLSVEGSSDVAYTTSSATPARFQTLDFSAACKKRTGRDISYVSFEIPASSRGDLCYNYSASSIYAEKVSSGTQYYRTRSPYLDSVSFVPAEGYAGTVRIGYRGVDTAGNAYSGQVTITVVERPNAEYGTVSYTTHQQEKVKFAASDFDSVCREATGASLDYVRFSLPGSSRGTLYYNYRSSGNYESKVAESIRYYRSGSPNLSNITFIPGTGAGSSVDIEFIGYNVNGDRFDGQIHIKITSGGGYGEVHYKAKSGQPMAFRASDFNEACLEDNDESLNYVRFELPDSSAGVLYYNYCSSGSYESRVSSSTRYYRNGSLSISNVTFVPKSGYDGTVEIDFSGYDTAGNSFDGTVYIQVEDSGTRQIQYSVASGGAAAFDADDFDAVCRAATGSSLNYLRIELPSSTRGTLYYQYKRTDGTYTGTVLSSTNYYRTGSNRLLDDVTFVAKKDFTGTVTIDYVGWSTGGTRFEGAVEIKVTTPVAATISYSGSAQPILFRSSDFSGACAALMGRELSYIQIGSLPDAAFGRLYLNYNGPNQVGERIAAGKSYYFSASPQIGQISFVPKAGFQGRVTLPYTGVDVKGERFSGAVEIALAANYGAGSFTDMANFAWAAPSVEYLYRFDIVNGIDSSKYGPGQAIRRGDFALMLCRSFQLNTGSTASFPDVAAGSYYAWAIATAKDLGIVKGDDRGLFQPDSMLTRQDAMVMIQRAMAAAGRSISSGNQSGLSAYLDGGQVSAYAKEAVEALIHMGIIQGDDTRKINPKAAMTRAEMAVILHRVLTL